MSKQNWTLAIFSFSFTVISFIIYKPFALYFLNDDLLIIPLNKMDFLSQPHTFRIIHEMLLTLEYHLFGKEATGYHYIQYIVHLLCSVLVYFFSMNLLKQYGNLKESENGLVSPLIAAFFSVYAFHSEATLWILGTTASLATVFFLLSTITYMKRDNGISYFICSLLFFQLGLLTYESNWVAPFFIFLLSWATVKRKQREWKKEKIYPIIYGVYFTTNLLIRRLIAGKYSDVYGDKQLFSIDAKRLFYNGICLFVRCFVPPSFSSTCFIVFTIGLFIILSFCLKEIMNKKVCDILVLILSLSFLASLVPVLTLGISTHSRESERYLYLPSVFLCLLIFYSLFKLSITGAKLYIVLICLFAYNIFFLYINARDYAVAGNIAKSYYTHLEKEKKDTGKIVLVKFPQQFNGLPLFRLGFKEGLVWMDSIATNRVEIPKDEELNVNSSYARAVTRSNFDFTFKESKTDSNKTIELVYDSTYFSIADFNKQ